MSRNLNQNLYAEEIIVESPYYYDNHGRLRIRVLEESAPMMRTADMRDRNLDGTDDRDQDEETQTRKEYLAQKKPINRDMRVRSPEEKAFEREREKQKDEEDYQKFKQEKAAKKGATPPAPVAPKPVKDIGITKKPPEGSDRKAPLTNDRPRLGSGNLKKTDPNAYKAALRDKVKKDVADLRNLKKTDPKAYEERSRKAREKLKANNLKKRGGSNINVKPTRPVPRPNLKTK